MKSEDSHSCNCYFDDPRLCVYQQFFLPDEVMEEMQKTYPDFTIGEIIENEIRALSDSIKDQMRKENQETICDKCLGKDKNAKCPMYAEHLVVTELFKEKK